MGFQNEAIGHINRATTSIRFSYRKCMRVLPGQKSGCHNEVTIINEVTGRGRGGGIEETVDDIKKQLCSLKSCGSQQKKPLKALCCI